MRLRLRIERNELPPVQVLHAIPPTQQSQTISQFLQSINALFPLESTTWDISDYTVLVAGYEATHYTEVGQAFKDEDEVVIKPLGFAELRARTLSGRDQISEDGRHLLDGVPFGRPMLKRPRRPEVNIPARKRQKADEVVDAQALLRLDADDEEDDEEDDEDFEEAEVEEDSEDDDENGAGDSGDSSDSDSSAKDSSSDGSASSSDDSSDSDSSSSSSSESESEASWDGLEGKVSTVKAAPKPNGTPAPQPEQQQNLPHQGKSRTKERNDRKRDSRRLKHLKEAGLLPQNATLQDMQNWQKEKDLDDESVTLAGQKAKMESGRQRLLEQIASGGVDIASPVSASREDDEPPEEQSSRPVATAKDIMDEATSSDAASTQIITEAQQAADTTPVKAKTKREADTDADQSPASKRARLDTRSMNRLVFGSLGLRTPKTQEERDALQKKLSTRPTRAGAATAPAEAMTEPTPQADEAPDSWREKVVLTAVECVDENVTLSEPPFPFQQRWDPQYQFSAKQRKRSRARKPNAQTNGEFIETYDKYNQNGGGDALDYDDPKDDQEGDDSYWEEGALLDNGDEAEGSDDEFPPLPADHASLPSLVEADAKVGDYITYQELAVSAATGWEPKVVAQIAKLETKTDDGFWTLVLRQSRPKEYDENGYRIYTKFEMEDFSDDGNETDSKTLSWVELQNPKLLLRSVDTKAS